MPIYNVIEYSKNYSKTFGTLWKYTRDISADPITNSESFKYKASIIENRFKQTNWTRISGSLWQFKREKSLKVPANNADFTIDKSQ